MHAVVLKYFLAVARHSSIRKAAQTLFVASSAVNRQILRLAEELGPQLFIHVPSGMRLNIAGRGISFFLKISFIDELDRGDVVWRPLANKVINTIAVGSLIPSHRSLSHVTRQFLDRITRRLKQLELAATL